MRNRGKFLLGSNKSILGEANALIKNKDSRFAIELFKFAREYVISLDFYRSAEIANFSFLRGLSEPQREKALESIKEKILDYVEPYLQSKLDDFKTTLNLSSARILLEIEKMAMADLYSQENLMGDINNPRLIISANEKLKALSMLGRYLGIFERDNLQRFNGTSINIDNSINKQEIENLQVNQNIEVKFINDNISKANIIDTQTLPFKKEKIKNDIKKS